MMFSSRDVNESILTKHYLTMPIQYTVIFHGNKNDYFQMNTCDIYFLVLPKTLIVGTR